VIRLTLTFGLRTLLVLRAIAGLAMAVLRIAFLARGHAFLGAFAVFTSKSGRSEKWGSSQKGQA
jgi:hypothetical protein